MDLKPGKKWECSKCSKTFKTNTKLTRHMVTHDPDAKVTCEKHIDTGHGTMDRPRFPCTFPACEKAYLIKGHLSRHINTKHAENPVIFPCTLCIKEFKTKFELEVHILTHTTEKPYNCATCGRSFAQKPHLKRHEKTHLEKSTRDRSKCHICPQTFVTRVSLQCHVRIVHENQRNFPCKLCDKRCSNSTGLRRHVEAKHTLNKELLKIHPCEKCEFKSHSEAYLAKHKIRHNAARHECYFCGKKVFTLGELLQHCRVHTLES
ncbi:zinc finger protein 25-like isoform X2 [Folsomia candida]|uniref:zinc finger protein 25-like isoform X2 n=1 Tax=Folsomia candida TaxID=158441 RepID=UPI001604AC65|nr:zinc finger protein 25-like isoform X2 [Folsomia candida]